MTFSWGQVTVIYINQYINVNYDDRMINIIWVDKISLTKRIELKIGKFIKGKGGENRIIN